MDTRVRRQRTFAADDGETLRKPNKTTTFYRKPRHSIHTLGNGSKTFATGNERNPMKTQGTTAFYRHQGPAVGRRLSPAMEETLKNLRRTTAFYGHPGPATEGHLPPGIQETLGTLRKNPSHSMGIRGRRQRDICQWEGRRPWENLKKSCGISGGDTCHQEWVAERHLRQFFTIRKNPSCLAPNLGKEMNATPPAVGHPLARHPAK